MKKFFRSVATRGARLLKLGRSSRAVTVAANTLREVSKGMEHVSFASMPPLRFKTCDEDMKKRQQWQQQETHA